VIHRPVGRSVVPNAKSPGSLGRMMPPSVRSRNTSTPGLAVYYIFRDGEINGSPARRSGRMIAAGRLGAHSF